MTWHGQSQCYLPYQTNQKGPVSKQLFPPLGMHTAVETANSRLVIRRAHIFLLPTNQSALADACREKPVQHVPSLKDSVPSKVSLLGRMSNFSQYADDCPDLWSTFVVIMKITSMAISKLVITNICHAYSCLLSTIYTYIYIYTIVNRWCGTQCVLACVIGYDIGIFITYQVLLTCLPNIL